jgi:hypothetical protein
MLIIIRRGIPFAYEAPHTQKSGQSIDPQKKYHWTREEARRHATSHGVAAIIVCVRKKSGGASACRGPGLTDERDGR